MFERHDDNKLKIIMPVNAACIVEAHHSRRFLEILNNNYVTFDGTVPYLFAKLLSRLRPINSVNRMAY
jgi:hypothetical protein